MQLVGVLATDGTISARVTTRASGAFELGMRASMQNRPDSTQRETMLRTLASSVYPEAKGDSLTLFDGKDFKAQPVISFVIRNGRATQQSGDVDLLNVHDRS